VVRNKWQGQAARRKELQVEGKTVVECIEAIDSRFPGFREKLVGKNGRLRKNFKVFVNDLNAYPGEPGKEVRDGDTVIIITYITGG
jgi:molybdopterin converting factor small subunit